MHRETTWTINDICTAGISEEYICLGCGARMDNGQESKHPNYPGFLWYGHRCEAIAESADDLQGSAVYVDLAREADAE